MVTNLEAIVIKVQEYNDFDLIVTVFSKKFGKLAFIAPGVRKITSKNRFSLMWLSYSSFEVFLSNLPNRLSKLKRGTLKSNALNITKKPQTLLFASFFTELIDRAFENREVNVEAFNLLHQTLNAFNNGVNLLVQSTFFIFKSLKWFGNNWNLQCCGRCLRKDRIITFSPAEECFLCQACLQDGDIVYRLSFCKLLRYFDNVMNTDNGLVNHWKYYDLILLHRILIETLDNKIGLVGYAFKQLLAKDIFLQ